MRLFWVHFSAGVKATLREPAYLVFAVAFPALFFLMFAAPLAQTQPGAGGHLLAAFTLYSVFVAVLSYFGIGQAQERASGFPRYRRTLPLPALVPVLAQMGEALVLALLGVLALALAAGVGAGLHLPLEVWVRLLPVLGLGGTVFGLLGAAMGRALSPRGPAPSPTFWAYPWPMRVGSGCLRKGYPRRWPASPPTPPRGSGRSSPGAPSRGRRERPPFGRGFWPMAFSSWPFGPWPSAWFRSGRSMVVWEAAGFTSTWSTSSTSSGLPWRARASPPWPGA